jgi:hypothetical protein
VAVSLIDEGNRSTGENHRPVASHWQTLSHNVASSVPRMSGIRTHNFSDVIGTAYIDSCKPNYHVITTTTSPIYWTCFQPEYSWNTVRWTSNNQSINQSYDWFAKPPQVYNVCHNFTDVDYASIPFFRLARSGLCCPNKKSTMTTEAVILFFTFQMRGINIFFNNRYEHQQKYFYCDFVLNALFTRES